MEKKGSNARAIGPMSLATSAELRAEIARKGYSVQQFARISGLPVSTLHKTLKGHRVVDVEDVFSICEALGVDPGALIDMAAENARSALDDGMLPGGREGMSADYRAPNVVRLDDHRPMHMDDEEAVASPRSADDGEDGGYD